MNDDQAPVVDNRVNKDWLQIWYKNCHSDIQWAKGQGWNAVQWSVVLLAAVFAASKAYRAISACVWIVFAVAIAGAGIWWLFDLHFFLKRTRDTALQLIKEPLKAEREKYLPDRPADEHHVLLLIVRLLVILGAVSVTVIQIIAGGPVN